MCDNMEEEEDVIDVESENDWSGVLFSLWL